MGEYAVDRQIDDRESTLTLYRRALAVRTDLQTEESLDWIETGRADVLRFARPNGWQVVTNFGDEPYVLDAGGLSVVLASDPNAAPDVVAPASTVWLAP